MRIIKVGDNVIGNKGEKGSVHSFKDRDDYPFDWVNVKWENYTHLEGFDVDNGPGSLFWEANNNTWKEQE